MSNFRGQHIIHNVGLGGADYQQTSTGHGWKKGPRNAPTVLNSVFNLAQFWDGRAKDLAEQAKGPVQARVEMNNAPDDVIKTLNSTPEYVSLFKKAFSGQENPVTFDNMAKAIEIFEATLITPDSKFDLFLKGDVQVLNQKEKEGLKLFMGHGCVSCHGGINMGGDGYYELGVVRKPSEKIIAGDKGRFAVTQAKNDEFSFKSPSLRNIALTPPYFHSGVVWDLKEAVSVMNDSQLGADLKEGDLDKIVAFLKSTTGKQPQVVHPILPAPTNTTPQTILGLIRSRQPICPTVFSHISHQGGAAHMLPHLHFWRMRSENILVYRSVNSVMQKRWFRTVLPEFTNVILEDKFN